MPVFLDICGSLRQLFLCIGVYHVLSYWVQNPEHKTTYEILTNFLKGLKLGSLNKKTFINIFISFVVGHP